MKPSQPPKPHAQGMSIWTLEQARKAIPYIHALMSSLREHRLEEISNHMRSKGLIGSPNPGRKLDGERARSEAQVAERSFQEAFDELQSLSIYPLNAIQGVALLPFIREHHLAWLIFDLFDEDPLRCWRYHDDPPQAIRLFDDEEATSDKTNPKR
jgi:hypothetical protein